MAQIVPGTDIDSAFVTLDGKRRPLGDVLAELRAPKPPDEAAIRSLITAEVSRQSLSNHTALEGKLEVLLNTINALVPPPKEPA